MSKFIPMFFMVILASLVLINPAFADAHGSGGRSRNQAPQKSLLPPATGAQVWAQVLLQVLQSSELASVSAQSVLVPARQPLASQRWAVVSLRT